MRVSIAGASGYAGGELLRLLEGHPTFHVIAAAAHSAAGSRIDSVHKRGVFGQRNLWSFGRLGLRRTNDRFHSCGNTRGLKRKNWRVANGTGTSWGIE